MANRSKCSLANEKEALELDPQLWQELPQEILERVISKLPFSRVVAFRTVCKEWYSAIIPRAARDVQLGSSSALLYVGQQESGSWDDVSCMSWLQVCNAGAAEEFQPKCCPRAKDEEIVELMICNQGLLFFGFRRSWKDNTVLEIVACNPLISQFKRLGLPCPLQPRLGTAHVGRSDCLVGVVFDANGKSYRLVVAGVDEIGKYTTFLYDSSTSTWTNGPSILPILLEHGGGVIGGRFGFERSVCSNGSLYWKVNYDSNVHVLKFDFRRGTWRMTPKLVARCGFSTCGCHITAYKGNIVLWHLHHTLSSWNAQHIHLACRFDVEVEWAPEIIPMDQDMIESIHELVAEPMDAWYSTFSHSNFIYHVMVPHPRSRDPDSCWKIVMHDTNENSYTELPILSKERFCRFGYISPCNVWSFSASLTLVP